MYGITTSTSVATGRTIAPRSFHGRVSPRTLDTASNRCHTFTENSNTRNVPTTNSGIAARVSDV